LKIVEVSGVDRIVGHVALLSHKDRGERFGLL
jgi:hypothetical protein